jgi:hypothetical protein
MFDGNCGEWCTFVGASRWSAEVYAAIRNSGDHPACAAGFSIELCDKAEQSLAAGIGGLLTQQLYRLTDGSNIIAACIGPGELTMAAVTDLTSDVAVDAVGTVIYRCPYFALDVVPIAGLALYDVKRATTRGNTLYTGTLVNALDVAVRNPSVTVFSVNRVGRPLNVASGSDTIEIPPGHAWVFTTSAVSDPGDDYIALPAGALAN